MKLSCNVNNSSSSLVESDYVITRLCYKIHIKHGKKLFYTALTKIFPQTKLRLDITNKFIFQTVEAKIGRTRFQLESM